ncbi:hypothetical protein [Rhodococcus ruber]|uniref:hypothetical protein n=1 Tax=Rhodococcus ruber TaxID=1830 RepID=UPI0037848F5A
MGLFGRGEAPVGLILDGQPALRALLGEVLVWDGTRSAFLSAVDMTAAAVLRTPGVRANAAPAVVPALTVLGGAYGPELTATSTPQAPAIAVPVVLRTPTVRADALVAVDPMTGAVQVLPGIGAENHDWNASVPAATGLATVQAPGVAANLNRQPPAVPVSALLRVPVVTATGSGTIAPQALPVSASVRAPVVSATAGAVSQVMTGSVSVPTPAVSGGASVSAVAATATAAMPAPVAEAVTFTPSGMTKTGTQSFTTAWAPLNGWTADTGTYPGSTVVSNALQVQGGKPDATISVSLPYSSTFTQNRRARIKLNGTVIATSGAFTANSGTITVSATGVAVADGDDITIDVIMETYASGSISANGTVTVT